jgi:hypothetical protein
MQHDAFLQHLQQVPMLTQLYYEAWTADAEQADLRLDDPAP